tara:strand:- start:246 stop:674 length:429 start_codon:yes stop_codon:yes gene_type:complete
MHTVDYLIAVGKIKSLTCKIPPLKKTAAWLFLSIKSGVNKMNQLSTLLKVHSHMSLTKEKTQSIIKEFGAHDKDTATPQVQIALLSSRLKDLNEHFKKNKQDNHSKRGLMKIIGQRRRLLNYFDKKNHQGYKELIQKLGIRR